MRGITLELLTDRANCDPQIFRLPLLCGSPRGAKQMLVREHLARVLRELSQDHKFLGREVHFLAVLENHPLEQVDRDVAGLKTFLIRFQLQLQ